MSFKWINVSSSDPRYDEIVAEEMSAFLERAINDPKTFDEALFAVKCEEAIRSGSGIATTGVSPDCEISLEFVRPK